MAESQVHGFKFEEFVLDNKINDIRNVFKKSVGYINEWDFPPISVKSFKNNGGNGTIEFGSIERVFSNKNSYFLFLIGYDQCDEYKIPTFSDILFIQQNEMKILRGELSLNEIYKLNESIKLFKLGSHNEARVWAKEQKKIHNYKTAYDIRFKIDSKDQRRIQCAIKLKDLYEKTNNKLILENKYGIPIIESKRRIRNKKNV